jgi:hypothetical protein
MGGPPSPFGPPGPSPTEQGPARFFKAAGIGGAIGGVASAIPLINWLNCCFCLLNMGGAVLAVHFYLKEFPNERLNNSDAALCGGMAGVVAGVIASVLGLLMNLLLGTFIASIYASLPPDLASKLAMQSSFGIIGIPVNAIIYGAFGALGGFLAMQLFFKERSAG